MDLAEGEHAEEPIVINHTSKIAVLEHRMNQAECRLDAGEARFKSIDEKLDRFKDDMGKRFDRLTDKMNENNQKLLEKISAGEVEDAEGEAKAESRWSNWYVYVIGALISLVLALIGVIAVML